MLRFGRSEQLTNVLSQGEYEEAVEDVSSLSLLYLKDDAARDDPEFAAELVDSYNRLIRKGGRFRVGGVFNSMIKDLYP